MRLRARVDQNQPEIVDILRQLGCSVWSTAACGKGAPDLVVWAPARNAHLLIEIKVPEEKLNPIEARWHAAWKGQV